MRRSIVALCLLALFTVAFSATSMGQDDLPLFLKNPHLSPDGKMIAFDYDGDIWTVSSDGGEAKRLTLHLAHERRPYFSPDGEWLLYSANYHGYYDLYVMPADGGEYRRLTYSPGNDIPSGWSADGEHCFFYSFRDDYYDAFKIPSKGGLPVRIAYSRRDPVYAPISSPDGSKVALNYRSGFSDWDRKANVTPNTSEIYIADNTSPVSNIRRMTDNWNQDYLPIWAPDGDTLYFVSDREGEYNFYSMDVSSGEVKRHTDLSDKGIRWYTVASKSGDIVIERKHRLYKLDPSTGETKLIPVTFFDPPKVTENDFAQAKVNITDFSVSPDCQKVAFISGHDVFIMAASGGYAKPLTRTYDREIHLSWAPDSHHVLFNRIVNRGLQVVQLNVYDGTEEVLTTGTDNKFTPFYMPDGKHIAYQHNYESIRMMDPANPEAEHKVLVEGVFGRRLMQSGRWFDFTHDGKWMTYLDYNDMMALDGKAKKLGTDQIVNLSPLGGYNYPGAFTADYSKLLFTNYNDGRQGVYVIDFEKTVKPRVSPVEKLEDLLKPKDPEKKQNPEKTAKPAKKPEKKKPSEQPGEKLDTSDLYGKTRPLSPAIKGTHYFVHLFRSGRTALVMQYSGNKYVAYACPVGGGKPQPILQANTRVTGLEVDKQERFFYFIMNGALHRAALANKKPVKLTPNSVMKPSNGSSERLAVFHEALWMLEHGFYDKDLHGLDMARIRDTYEPLVKRCVNDAQFRRVMSEILAEFNASHMSIGSRPGENTAGVVQDNSPHIGFIFDPALADKGTLRITHLVENTPAAAENSGLKVGDYVISTEGTKVEPGVNPHQLVRNKLGSDIKLQVADSPDAEETRTVYLPTVNLQVFYSRMISEWENINRKYVAEKSDGKFGYVCLRSMMDPDYAKFKQDISRYLANYEGIVLDFRYNSGGRIAHKIAEVLDDSPWLYSGMRGGRWVPEDVHRDFSVQKAVVGMFNERTFSNAEMMLAGFRIKKLGPTVGMPTSGGVIGTWPKTLLDGSTLRLPRFRVYDSLGRNLERNPTKPEHIIDETFVHHMKGDKVQLDKALELLREETKRKAKALVPDIKEEE